MRRLILLLLIAAVLCCVVGVPVGAKPADESQLKIKTVDHFEVTEEKSLKSVNDFAARKNKWDNGGVTQAAVKADGNLHHIVNATVRKSGGITVELYCQDNMGYFMPIWGGSITTQTSVWDLSLSELHRKDVDGCYFGVVDSTAAGAL